MTSSPSSRWTGRLTRRVCMWSGAPPRPEAIEGQVERLDVESGSQQPNGVSNEARAYSLQVQQAGLSPACGAEAADSTGFAAAGSPLAGTPRQSPPMPDSPVRAAVRDRHAAQRPVNVPSAASPRRPLAPPARHLGAHAESSMWMRCDTTALGRALSSAADGAGADPRG
eukprot:CAMPEP_0179842362 /NCGR_PEP_ID=MMETSP0982-20121206/3082_1 /TAXON_ID=483367 /ORGANISM="non described non described, Strain CCMP 2436" /LENGTH=168 /DNA_ID=CAMNT_0021726621 /DNA_START=118 /DNA_END=621 /DNA_ORIENTATION=+